MDMIEASSADVIGAEGAGAAEGPGVAASLGVVEADAMRPRGGVGDSSGILGRDLTTVESLMVPKL